MTKFHICNTVWYKDDQLTRELEDCERQAREVLFAKAVHQLGSSMFDGSKAKLELHEELPRSKWDGWTSMELHLDVKVNE